MRVCVSRLPFLKKRIMNRGAFRISAWVLLVCIFPFLLPPAFYVECTTHISLEATTSRSSPSPSANDSSLPSALAATEADFLAWIQQMMAESKHAATDALFSTSAASTNINLITVAKSGTANFTTVQDAVNAVPSNNNQRVVIQIAAGTYTEKVNIPSYKPYISLFGAGADVTTITWDDTATSAGSTYKSASVAIDSNFFIASGISFENSAPAPPQGAVGRQAVALRITGDKAAFYSCNFYGAQDTLYDNQGRHYFKSCIIQGSIDFIFGDGRSYYYDCNLYSISTGYGSSLTAQRRGKPSEKTGFSFVNCKVSGSGMLYLGRAWGPYSRVVFLFTYMDNIIIPAGWDDYGDPSNQQTAFYGEYQCSGPGANSKDRVAWSYQLTAEQAAPFQTLNFVDGASWVKT